MKTTKKAKMNHMIGAMTEKEILHEVLKWESKEFSLVLMVETRPCLVFVWVSGICLKGCE